MMTDSLNLMKRAQPAKVSAMEKAARPGLKFAKLIRGTPGGAFPNRLDGFRGMG